MKKFWKLYCFFYKNLLHFLKIRVKIVSILIVRVLAQRTGINLEQKSSKRVERDTDGMLDEIPKTKTKKHL